METCSVSFPGGLGISLVHGDMSSLVPRWPGNKSSSVSSLVPRWPGNESSSVSSLVPRWLGNESS